MRRRAHAAVSRGVAGGRFFTRATASRGCGGDLAWLSRRGVDYDLSSLFVFMQQQPNQH